MIKFKGQTWTIKQVQQFWEVIDSIGNELGITYPNTQIEILSADQMIEVISNSGMPLAFDHWSMGKEAANLKNSYRRRQAGLALELIVNTNPTTMYVAETNTLIAQGLVLAHAGIGHGSVFKNNYLFKQWSNPNGILDFYLYAREYFKKCEEVYASPTEVEHFLDTCLTLKMYGVSYRKAIRMDQLKANQKLQYNEYLSVKSSVLSKEYMKKITGNLRKTNKKIAQLSHYDFPEENLLYFFEKHGLKLQKWQRETLRIFRKISEHFYPHYKTKLLHEGWASFVQMRVFDELYNRGHIDEGGYLEFLRLHTDVLTQRDGDSSHYSGLNPYAIGYAIFDDLYRMSKNPTMDDIREYPEICNTKWQDSLMDIVTNYDDHRFIQRYLTKNVIAKFKLFAVSFDLDTRKALVEGTRSHVEDLRQFCADEWDYFNHIPRLEINGVQSFGGDKILIVKSYGTHGRRLDETSYQNLSVHLRTLWGNRIKLEEIIP